MIVIHKSILPDTSIAPAPSPPSSPSHSLPDSSPPPTIEQGAPGARNDDVIDSQLQYNPPPPGPKSQLPVHLREKWIVAREEPIKPIKLKKDADGNFTIVQDGSISPISFHPPSPFNIPNTMASNHAYPWLNPTMLNSMMYQNVAQPNPLLLPYKMMPQQQPSNPFYTPSSY